MQSPIHNVSFKVTTAEYVDLIPNLLPGPSLSRCDTMVGCSGIGIIGDINVFWLDVVSNLFCG